MTPMQIEKQRWIDRYNETAVKIGQPEYHTINIRTGKPRWVSDSLKQIKQRYAKVRFTFKTIKHLLKPAPELKIIKEI